jgi:hypothetical protein
VAGDRRAIPFTLAGNGSYSDNLATGVLPPVPEHDHA